MKTLSEKLKYLYELDTIPKVVDSSSILTQTIQGYFVQPDLMMIDAETNDRAPLIPGRIFSHGSRILLEGPFGSGKSVLLQKFSLETEGFKYIFRIKLKLLLDKWKQGYLESQLDENELACFIHYSITKLTSKVMSRANKFDSSYKIKLSEIQTALASENHEEILLLLDGDNDVALLSRNEEAKEYFYQLLEYPKLIMSSRSNSLNQLTLNEFDLKVEVEGFTPNQIRSYISKFFTNQMSILIQEVENFFSKEQHAHLGKKELLVNLGKQKHSQTEGYEISVQLRKIDAFEPLGVDRESIILSITKYYQSSETQLLELLEDYNLKELAQSPIITSMLCLLFSDPISRNTLTKSNLTTSKLYEKFVVWLGKKYFYEMQALEIEDITEERILTSSPFLSLKEIAYECIRNNNLISGKLIDSIARKYSTDVRSIYNLGILKIVNFAEEEIDNTSLVSHQHSFIRLSVQDYLVALLLKEKLNSSNEQEAKEAASFIASIRNEAKYLTMLKFMAEIMSHSPDNIGLIRFWEAVTCNVDGVLELGADMKVTLLMHLLEKARIDSRFDARIPNLVAIEKFIEDVVLEDILRYTDTIKASGYLSEQMADAIWEKLVSFDMEQGSIMVEPSPVRKNKHLSFQELITLKPYQALELKNLTSLIMSLAEKLGPEKLFENLIVKLSNENWQIREMAIRVLSHFSSRLEKIFLPEKVEEILIKLQESLVEERLSDVSIDAIVNLVQLHEKAQILVQNIISESLPILLVNKKMTKYLIKLFIKFSMIDSSSNFIDVPGIINDIYLGNVGNLRRKIEQPSEVIKFLGSSLQKDLQTLTSSSPELNNIVDILIGLEKEGHTESTLVILNSIIQELTDTSHYQSDASSILINLAVQSDFALNKLISEVSSIVLQKNDLLKQNILPIVLKILAKNNRAFDSSLIPQFINFLEELILEEEYRSLSIDLLGKIITKNEIESSEVSRIVYKLEKTLKNFPAEKQIIYRALVSIATKMLDEEAIKKIFDILLEVLTDPLTTYKISISNDLIEITKKSYSAELSIKMFDSLRNLFLSNQEIQALLTIPLSKLLLNPSVGQTLEDIEISLMADIYISSLSSNIAARVIASIETLSNADERIKKIFFEKLQADIFTKSITTSHLFHAIQALEKLNYTLSNNKVLLNKLIEKIGLISIDSVFANLINNITLSNSELLQFTLDKLILIVNQSLTTPKSSYQSAKNALKAIGKIIETNTLEMSLLNSIFEQIVSILDTNQALKANAIYLLSKVIQKENFALEDPTTLLQKFLKLTNTSDSEIVKNSCIAIKYILVKHNFVLEKITEIIEKISPLLGKAVHPLAFDIIIESLKQMSFSDSTKYLNSSNESMRKVTVEFFNSYLQQEIVDIDISDIESWGESLENMLLILSRKTYENSPEIRRLHELTKKISLKHVDSAKDEHILWVNEYFDKLHEIAGFDFENLMLHLHHIALQDHEITSIESNFFIKCIKTFGFTNVIYSPKRNGKGEVEFKILFDGTNYIFIGKQNLKHMEYIARALIQSADELASQYQKNVPLFKNSGLSIPIAASDIQECKSLITGENLVAGKSQVSLLCLSDDLRQNPTSAFILSEERILGFYVVYKIYFKGGKLAVFHQTLHPLELEKSNIREEIFKGLNYNGDSIPQYFGNTWLLGEEANLLFHRIHSIKENLEPNLTYLDDNPTHLLFAPLIREVSDGNNSPSPHASVYMVNYFRLFKLLDDIVNAPEITGTWSDDVESLEVFSAEVLSGKQHTQQIERIIQNRRLKKVEDKALAHELAIQEMKDKLSHIDFKVLEAVLNDKIALEDEIKELEIIKGDKYLLAFYKALVWQLNAMYIASSAIASGIVESSEKDLTGNLGALLKFAGTQTPLVGIAMNILGQIFEGYGEYRQNLKISNYATIASDSNEMSILVKSIARKLALSKLTFVEKPKNIIEKFIETASTIVEMDIAQAITTICEDLKTRADIASASEEYKESSSEVLSYAKRFVLAHQLEPTDEQRGEADAAIVVKVIIANIFLGSYKSQTDIVEAVVKDVIAEATDNTALTLVSSTAHGSITSSSNEHTTEQQGEHSNWWLCCTSILRFLRIYKAEIPKENPITELLPEIHKIIKVNHPKENSYEFLSLGGNEEKYAKFISSVEEHGLEKAIDRIFIRKAFDNMLEFAKILYLKPNEVEILAELGTDEANAKEILAAIEERGLKPVLNDLLNLESEFVTENLAQNLLDNIEGFNQFTLKDSRFKDFIDAILFKRGTYKQLEQILSQVTDFYKKLQSLIDMEAWFEYLQIDTRDLVTINLIQLEGVLEQLGSNNFAIGVPTFRPPFSDFPGDEGGSGGSGSAYIPNHSNPVNETSFIDIMGILYTFKPDNSTDHSA